MQSGTHAYYGPDGVTAASKEISVADAAAISSSVQKRQIALHWKNAAGGSTIFEKLQPNIP
ncbi:MAG: hypothetical protein ACLR5S_05475 [Ruminococcus sp.]